jgi:hypothetical protein
MSAAFAAGGLMTKRTRRSAALGMLVASCAAILATSPGDPTAAAAVEGDVAVEPGNPAEIVVQFEVAAPDSTIEMNRAQIRFFTGFFAPEFSELVTATADGFEVGPNDTSELALPLVVCRDGCEVVMRAVITWNQSSPADALRARWNAELSVVYENSVPPGTPVTARTVEGDGPPIGRHGWLILGAVITALSGAAGIALGGRLARVRLGLAALGVIPPAWFLWELSAYGFTDPFGSLDPGTLLIAAGVALLGIGLVVGVVRTSRGDPVALPAAGWAYLVIVGYFLWLGVEHFATYRPHEVALLAAGLALPGMAALTAVPPQRLAPAGLRFGTSFVMASMIAEFAVTLAVAGGLVLAFVVSLVGPGARIDGTMLLGVIPILVAAGFVLGFQAWPAGDRRFLGVASTATLLVLIPVLIVTVDGLGGLLFFPLELAAVAAICLVVNLLGLIGLFNFPPPGAGRPAPPDHQGDEERGEHEQVARVADELDVDRSGDRA